MRLVDEVHSRYVAERRARVLSRHFAALLPRGARVLDVGCGDGRIDQLVLERRPDLRLSGIDVVLRQRSVIRVERFDGREIAYADNSFDAVLLVDVLHHSQDPDALLRHVRRVAAHSVILKDVVARTGIDHAILRFMDRVGNERFGVSLPYAFWSPGEWRDALRRAGLRVNSYDRSLGLYPPPASWVFERSMHFIALCSAA